MIRLLLKYRFPFIVALHLAVVAVVNVLAFLLRFDGDIPGEERWLLFSMLPVLLAIRGLMFLLFRLYEGLWRYTSIWDLRNIIAAVGSSALVFYTLVHWGLGLTRYPRAVFLIDAILLICFLGGIRLGRRIYRELGYLEREKRVLVFGAGDAGEMIVRDMKNNSFYDYEPVGFVDDDVTKVGKRIHGVPVLGTRAALPHIMASTGPHEVLVAMPASDPATIRGIVKALEPFKVPIKTLPNLRDVLDDRVTVSQIRNLHVEDLLPRPPVGLDTTPIRELLRGKRVLVTGAGGSIGSELCRQIAAFQPSMLSLYDRYENGLYTTINDLERSAPDLAARAVVGDVTDVIRLDDVFAAERPHIIFHAAAHKHVPLMEANPCEAVKNNVTGTRVVAEAAERHGVAELVLISTDKAVNPAGVMGATKRVAELLVQAMSGLGTTTFVTVRFGNVLASNGSVLPRFLEQIRMGGPVTVTHPEMRRYFMLIPEAVQLVLHAAGLAEPGAVYALDMGEQIKIVEMARNVIRLSGFVPDQEIPIAFVGTRPGEKLFEELVGHDETAEAAPIDKIMRIRSRWAPDPETLAKDVFELEQFAVQQDTEAVIRRLAAIVPTFEPAGR